MIAPAPKVFSIWLIVLLSAFCSAVIVEGLLDSAVACFLATARSSNGSTRLVYVRIPEYHRT
jgi:hypothetical protein